MPRHPLPSPPCVITADPWLRVRKTNAIFTTPKTLILTRKITNLYFFGPIFRQFQLSTASTVLTVSNFKFLNFLKLVSSFIVVFLLRLCGNHCTSKRKKKKSGKIKHVTIPVFFQSCSIPHETCILPLFYIQFTKYIYFFRLWLAGFRRFSKMKKRKKNEPI